MTGLTYLRDLIGRIAALFGGQRREDFTCGDCAMSERCGLPPTDACVARAAQIASGRTRRRPLPGLDAPY